ncbi:MAG TPA: hypothetical protein VMX58_01950 [Patescibacteria group bacterium]|nr:hypothetical protein [Patescibacteria group bacterium]
MKKIDLRSFGITTIIRRALEGNVSPLNFALVLGFFSSLVILYIALHVQSYSVSEDLTERTEHLELLLDQHALLTAHYNDLVSPDRIIPLVEQMGMRPGSPEEVRRFALYDSRERESEEINRWATVTTAEGRIDGMQLNTVEPEGR